MKQPNNHTIILQRDVPGILIPDGFAVLLKRGQEVCMTQVLGGKFTVQTTQGQLIRLDGQDADALGKEIPKQALGQIQEGAPLQEQAWQALRACYDPEIPVNIVELGLIYNLNVVPLSKKAPSENSLAQGDSHGKKQDQPKQNLQNQKPSQKAREVDNDGYRIEVRMTLTAPGCGMGEILQQDIQHMLAALAGVKEVQVELVFDPPWDASRMSEAARLQLGML